MWLTQPALALWIVSRVAAGAVPQGSAPPADGQLTGSLVVAWEYAGQIDLTAGVLSCDLTARLRATGNVAVVRFALAPTLPITFLRIDANTYRPIAVGAGLYRVTLAEEWADGSDHEIQIRYAGTPPAPDIVSRALVELNASSNWYPRFSHVEHFTTTLRVHAGPELRLITRGRAEGADSSGQQLWVDRQPSAALALLGARLLDHVELRGPSIAVEAYFNAPQGSDVARRAEALAAQVIATHRSVARRFGRQRKVTLISLLLMPHATERAGDTVFLAFPAEHPTAESIDTEFDLARRVAAAWWPFAVVEPQDEWLFEGLRETAALAEARDKFGAAVYTQWLSRLQQLARAESQPLAAGAEVHDSVAPAAAPAAQAIDQPPLDPFAARAGMVLNALRLQLGDARFDELMRQFTALVAGEPRWGTTAGFERLTSTLGDFGWFWQQWLERPELPDIRFRWFRMRLPRSGQTVSVEIRQAGQPFGFRAPIRIVAGKRTYWQSVEVHNADTILGIPVRGRVMAVEFDPEYQLLRAAAPPGAAQ